MRLRLERRCRKSKPCNVRAGKLASQLPRCVPALQATWCVRACLKAVLLRSVQGAKRWLFPRPAHAPSCSRRMCDLHAGTAPVSGLALTRLAVGSASACALAATCVVVLQPRSILLQHSRRRPDNPGRYPPGVAWHGMTRTAHAPSRRTQMARPATAGAT